MSEYTVDSKMVLYFLKEDMSLYSYCSLLSGVVLMADNTQGSHLQHIKRVLV